MDIQLRDYFAAKAMAALITETGLMLDDFAGEAYDIADKMMVARDKRREETQADPSQTRVHGMPQGIRDRPWRSRTTSYTWWQGLG